MIHHYTARQQKVSSAPKKKTLTHFLEFVLRTSSRQMIRRKARGRLKGFLHLLKSSLLRDTFQTWTRERGRELFSHVSREALNEILLRCQTQEWNGTEVGIFSMGQLIQMLSRNIAYIYIWPAKSIRDSTERGTIYIRKDYYHKVLVKIAEEPLHWLHSSVTAVSNSMLLLAPEILNKKYKEKLPISKKKMSKTGTIPSLITLHYICT